MPTSIDRHNDTEGFRVRDTDAEDTLASDAVRLSSLMTLGVSIRVTFFLTLGVSEGLVCVGHGQSLVASVGAKPRGHDANHLPRSS